MIKKTFVAIFVLSVVVSGVLPRTVLSGEEPSAIRRVEDFSSFKVGTFPEGWKSRGGEGSIVYRVRSNKETYLEADAVNSAVAIAKEFEYDPKEYPFLEWQWRVLELPQGGDERYKKTGGTVPRQSM